MTTFEYCPNCGEHVDRGLYDVAGEAPCDNCETHVEPITDADDAAMPFKALHPIRCTDCKERVALAGLHMGQYTDGVIVACGCDSLGAIPSELGEPELPSQWEILHDARLESRRRHDDEGDDADDGQQRLVTDGGTAQQYTVELTDRELTRVLLALTVYADKNNEPSDGETRQIRGMIAECVEPTNGGDN